MEILPFISFFTGVISILSPCILPILPIFVGVSLKSKTKTSIISFLAGLMTIFIAIIFLTGFFTSLLYTYMPYLRLISSLLLLAIGIMMFFDYSITFKRGFNVNDIESSFLMGLLTSIAWIPCYSGYLISLIALLVNSNSAGYAVFNIILYVIGFALTLLVLSLIISRIDLEKFISKAKYIPKIFSILVIIGAIYLLTSIF